VKFDLEILNFLLISFFGLLILLNCNDLVTLFLGIEVYTLPIYILSASKTFSFTSSEAALKYFIVSTCVTAILALNISYIYYICGTTNYSKLYCILLQIDNNTVLYILYTNLVIVFLFKLAIVPLHM